MKTYVVLFLFVFISCNSTKKMEGTKSSDPKISMECPKEGTCTFSLLENKSFRVLEDGIGMKYPELSDNPNTSIIKFTFHHEAPNGMVDGNYTEKVFLEIENDIKSLDLKGEELQKVKLLYGRFCYCKGNVGYFKVTDGTLHYERKKNGAAIISVVFENHKVPQKIKKIEGTVSF